MGFIAGCIHWKSIEVMKIIKAMFKNEGIEISKKHRPHMVKAVNLASILILFVGIPSGCGIAVLISILIKAL